MATLAYKTRGDSSPQNKERVYFSCHPQDFSLYFSSICEDIFQTQNCVIWYDAEPETGWEPMVIEEELGRMQLFVVPVTSRFLYQPSHARNVEFRFAVEHHIPILPLLQEEGLSEDFGKICGDMQYLDKKTLMSDRTAVPYAKKLEQFLKTVLLGDEMAAQVREAFDAYIFLSYRKKDRRYAQELMRLIHQNDFCQDIAIWYDEFLVPGENFNDAIRDALEKSELFALVVTPNLVNESNYVMTIEYPEARKSGKPILPAQMVPTDPEALREHYEGIPAVTDGHDRPVLSAALLDWLKSLAIAENDDDPKHLFFIGLAYLSGIDVEEDRSRGVRLIRTAAEHGLPEAMEKMSRIYATGEGVERDYEMSAQWMEKLVAYREEAFAKTGTEDDGFALFLELENVGEAWEAMGKLAQARAVYEKQLEVNQIFREKFGEAALLATSSITYHKLGNISQKAGNLRDAEDYYEKCVKFSEQLGQDVPSEIQTMVYPMQALTYERLGDIRLSKGNLSEAKHFYLESLKINQQWEHDMPEAEYERILLVCYACLGDVCWYEGNFLEAKEYFEKCLEQAEHLHQEQETIASLQDVATLSQRLGDVSQKIGDYTTAKSYYEKCQAIFEKIDSEVATMESCRNLFGIYTSIAGILREPGNFTEAKTLYEKGLEICEKLYSETDTEQSQWDLAIAYSNLGDINVKEENPDQAKYMYLKSCELFEELVRKNETVQIRMDLSGVYFRLGELSEKQDDRAYTKEMYEKCLKIRETVVRETNVAHYQQEMCMIYGKLGVLSEANDDLPGARSYYEKCLEYAERAERDLGTPDSRHYLLSAYNKLGAVSEAEGRYKDAKDWYQKALPICMKAYEETKSAQARHDLFSAHTDLADMYFHMKKPKKAREWLLKSIVVGERLEQDSPDEWEVSELARSYRNMAGTYAKKDQNKVVEWTRKELTLKEKYCNDMGMEEIKKRLQWDYDRMGDELKKLRKFNEAQDFYIKGLKVRKEIYSSTKDPADYHRLAVSYYNIGIILDRYDLKTIKDPERIGKYLMRNLKDAEKILLDLSGQYPENSLYVEDLTTIREAITELDDQINQILKKQHRKVYKKE